MDGWSPPGEFGEYRVVRSLGGGAMGQVFLAQDTQLARPVAIKFIAASDPSPHARERFLVEARAAARLNHPNVVAIHRVGSLEQRPYLVSEFVKGRALVELETPLGEAEAVQIGLGIARGLAEAHEHGILHRDIKPANVILTQDGTPKLADFGLAKLPVIEPSPRLTTMDVDPKRKLTVDVPTPARAITADLSTLRPRAATQDVPTVQPRAATQDVPAAPPRAITANRGAATLLRPPTRDLEAPKGTPALTWVPAAPAGAAKGRRGLTAVGSIMGTPDYMSPEAWLGEEATARSDVYSFGALLYELLTGATPFAFVPEEELPTTVVERAPPPLREVAGYLNPRLATLVDACLRLDPNDRPHSASEVRDQLEDLVLREDATSLSGNPYRGLQPFDVHHRGVFFGREVETDEIVSRLARGSFIIVTGDSGTGKSSICRAGVLPRCTHSGLLGGRSWSTVTLTPGPQPLTRLVGNLCGLARLSTPELLDLALTDPRAAVSKLHGSLADDRGLLILIDQLEELVTQATPEERDPAEAFIHELSAGHPALKVLATVRADLLTQVARLPLLGEQVGRGLHLLRPMSPDRIRRTISDPAEAMGYRFESEAMVDELLAFTEASPSSLPLLQFALSRLWEERDDERRLLPEAGLSRIGGVGGALARHADLVIDSLLPQQRSIARNLLMGLVGPGGVRLTRSSEDLIGPRETWQTVLDRLVEGRLISVGDDESGTQCTLVHEILVHRWDALARWVAADAELARVREGLRTAAADWRDLGGGREGLWSGQRLREASSLVIEDLGEMEARFLKASQRARRWVWFIRVGLVVAVPLVVGLAQLEARLRAQSRLDAKVTAALDRADVAADRARPLRAKVLEQREHVRSLLLDQRRAPAESLWQDVLTSEVELGALLRRQSQALEAAMMLAPERELLRSRFADNLLDRLTYLERNRNFAQREEMIQRLSLYDLDGSKQRLWRAPGELRLRELPPDADISVERYVEKDGAMTTEAVETASPLELLPGSYRATIRSSGLEWVHAFVLAPGEILNLDGTLPPPQGPEGFVYIPKGRFQFGSIADEGARLGFFDAPPLHTVKTGAFWIGRHEVSFADWIAWLETLPPKEAEARRPGMVDDEGLTTGGVRLRRDRKGRWLLEFQPGDRAYRALAGERLVYADRGARKSQDWLRFPVVAVSAEDGEAYARWLDQTGRVPGARLCSEHEWERAAKGADARPYPSGPHLRPTDANFDKTYDKKPGGMGLDEVGSHPGGQSPFGVDDLAGNAFEWTTSSLDESEYVLRGGSYYYDAATNRSANRSVAVATLRVASVGLRICANVDRNPNL